ncbi:ATP-binding protein [Streptomyces sp. NPDC091259]|uniref:ATP-binding protein n=1 Tax=Streptomyces sp. NPDC091259 TaxID=3365976 RepID=UPI00382487EC
MPHRPNPLPVRERAEAVFKRTGRLDADARRPGQARRIVTASMGAWRLRDYVDDAVLLVSELVTNAFRHGTGRTLRVRLHLTQKYLCEVRSGNAGAAHAKVAADFDEGGRGLFLVSQIADVWAVSADGAGMWCTLAITRGRD